MTHPPAAHAVRCGTSAVTRVRCQNVPRSAAYQLRAAVLAALAACAVVGPATLARADVRQVSAGYERPVVPSLDNRPPETQTHRYPNTLSVRYDRDAGSLTITTVLFAPEVWNYELGVVPFSVGESCEEDTVKGSYTGAKDYVPGSDEPGPVLVAALSIAGYVGQATGSLTFNGHAFTASWSHPALRGLDLRCVTLGGGDGDWSVDPLYFDGYKPIKLTVARATVAFRRYLEDRFDMSEPYVKCGYVFDGDDDSQVGDCMAHFRSGQVWHFISASPVVEADDYRVTFPRTPFTRAWTRKWRKAGPKCLRGYPKGVLYSNAWGCDARMASEIYRGTTGWHGTGTGFYLPITRYSCHRKRRTYTCRNGVGDAFRWTPARR